MTTLAGRLQWIIDRRGYRSASALARASSVAEATLTALLRASAGHALRDDDNAALARIAECARVSPRWLAQGKGSPEDVATEGKRLRDLQGWAAAEAAARASGVGPWAIQEVGSMAPWPSLKKLTPALVRDLCVIVLVSAPLAKVFGPDEPLPAGRSGAKLASTRDSGARRRGSSRT